MLGEYGVLAPVLTGCLPANCSENGKRVGALAAAKRGATEPVQAGPGLDGAPGILVPGMAIELVAGVVN
jgi:hypothetical protein